MACLPTRVRARKALVYARAVRSFAAHCPGRGRTFRRPFGPSLGGRRVFAAQRRKGGTGGPPAPATPKPPPDIRSAEGLLSFSADIARWVRRLGVDHQDQPDMVQTILLAALPQWENLVIHSDTTEAEGRRRWLFEVTRRRVMSYHRARRRTSERSGSLDSISEMRSPSLEDPGTLEEELSNRREAAEIQELRDATSAERWAVLILRHVEELTIEAIATMQGVPFGTVASRLRHGRMDLRAALERTRARRRFDAGKAAKEAKSPPEDRAPKPKGKGR